MGFFSKFKEMFSSTGAGGVAIVDISKRFELIGRTGQGSMSKVWRARDRESGRTVCVKILDKEKTIRFESRFFGLKKPSEGAICMLLKHENIVRTFEHGITTDKEPFIMMELVDGVGLNYFIETKHKDLQGNRVNFLKQYSLGIEYMHKTGFLHRDICPRNVMINKERVVKIIDLGLAIPFTPAFCKPGNRTGTTMYLAPELIKRSTTDQRVDMFALGVTAFEVFTGDFPWEKGNSQEVLIAIVNQAPRSPRDFRPDLPDDVVAFLMKGIERDPNLRFQNAADFRTALLQLKGEW